MKWVCISGSRRVEAGTKAEKDVRREVRRILSEGNGIVSGGALGVDYFATDEAIKLNPEMDKVKIFLPATLGIYSEHYRKRAEEGVITKEGAEDLISQLTKIKEAGVLVENLENRTVDRESYFNRNSEIVNSADELIAFRVTNSGGTEDTINKAREKGIPVKEFKY